MDQTPAETSPRPTTPRRRDAAGWALSAATLAVLAVGVIVIRGVRGERPTRPPETSGRTTAGEPSDPPPRVILALPTVRDERQLRPGEPQSTGIRVVQDPFDLR